MNSQYAPFNSDIVSFWYCFEILCSEFASNVAIISCGCIRLFQQTILQYNWFQFQLVKWLNMWKYVFVGTHDALSEF